MGSEGPFALKTRPTRIEIRDTVKLLGFAERVHAFISLALSLSVSLCVSQWVNAEVHGHEICFYRTSWAAGIHGLGVVLFFGGSKWR